MINLLLTHLEDIFGRDKVIRIVRTQDVIWTTASRVALGVLLLTPIPIGVGTIWASSGNLPIGTLLRFIEIIAGVSFVFGCVVRISVYPTFLIFVLHILANASSSISWIGNIVGTFINANGDLAYGATYFGATVLLLDIARTGAGRFSVDSAIYRLLESKYSRTPNRSRH